MQRAIVAFLLSLMLIGMTAVASSEVSEGTPYLAGYFDYYHCQIPLEAQQRAAELMSPVTMQIGDVRITFQEVIYDGRWLYGAASVVPNDPSKTLILPGDSELDMPVAGHYVENERQDTRTFREAAREDNKELLAVYVYPRGEVNSYAIDSFQLKDNTSILFSSIEMPGEQESLRVAWQIEIYHVSLDTGIYTQIHSTVHYMDVHMIAPLEKQAYALDEGAGAPFGTVTLVKSGLACYLEPDWIDANKDGPLFTMLYDLDGHHIPWNGVQIANVFAIDIFPEKLLMYIKNDGFAGELRMSVSGSFAVEAIPEEFKMLVDQEGLVSNLFILTAVE